MSRAMSHVLCHVLCPVSCVTLHSHAPCPCALQPCPMSCVMSCVLCHAPRSCPKPQHALYPVPCPTPHFTPYPAPCPRPHTKLCMAALFCHRHHPCHCPHHCFLPAAALANPQVKTLGFLQGQRGIAQPWALLVAAQGVLRRGGDTGTQLPHTRYRGWQWGWHLPGTGVGTVLDQCLASRHQAWELRLGYGTWAGEWGWTLRLGCGQWD